MANINELQLPDGTIKIIEDGTLWSGHRADWEDLTTEQQSKYRYVMFDDDSETGEVTDAVTDGDMRAVTSNAVYDNFADLKDPINISANSDLNDYTNPGDYISVNTDNTATLSNVPTPVASAFLLMVRNIGGQKHQIKMQIIMNEINEAIYLRSINLGIGRYHEWKKIDMVDIS